MRAPNYFWNYCTHVYLSIVMHAYTHTCELYSNGYFSTCIFLPYLLTFLFWAMIRESIHLWHFFSNKNISKFKIWWEISILILSGSSFFLAAVLCVAIFCFRKTNLMKVTTFSAAEVSVRPQYTPTSYLSRDEPVRMSRVQPWIGLYKSAVTVLLLTCRRR